MSKSLDFESSIYICPFCGSEEYMRIVKDGDIPWEAVVNQKCSECDEPFDLETWQDSEFYDGFHSDDEDEIDDDNFIKSHGFFLDDEKITEDDYNEDYYKDI